MKMFSRDKSKVQLGYLITKQYIEFISIRHTERLPGPETEKDTVMLNIIFIAKTSVVRSDAIILRAKFMGAGGS